MYGNTSFLLLLNKSSNGIHEQIYEFNAKVIENESSKKAMNLTCILSICFPQHFTHF